MKDLRADDLAHCRATIRSGSLSFHAASRLLPVTMRDPALILYAFCRHADDEVDEGQAKTAAVLRLRDRLDLVYAGRPLERAEDRAFAAVVAAFEMPKALPEALLEGLAWDAQVRRYQTLSDVRAYAARVAAAVGAMMCVLMRVRDPHALARACDLGVAMQLTNIARDVGEDARAGRLYLPLDWMAEFGVDPARFMTAPQANPAIRRMTARLLSEAERLYLRSEPGITALPHRARMGIWAARLIYAAIGHQVRRNDCDSFSHRARTTGAQKLRLMALASAKSAAGMVMPQSAVLYAKPLSEVAWLVDAAARHVPSRGRTLALIDTLADLTRREASGVGGGGQRA